LLDGIATYQAISAMIQNIFPIMQNKDFDRICNNVNYNLHHYPFFICVKSLELWYVDENIWQDYVENGKKKRKKTTDNFGL
jgi:hypothetical protein